VLTVEIRVGRLAEAIFASPIDEPEADQFARRIGQIIRDAGRPLVFCSDLRKVRVFPPAVADRFIAMMRSDNPGVERNALLIAEGSVFSLQIERMLREGKHPGRRTFREEAPLVAYLDEVLDPPERARLRSFLAGA
jgi:hypothetical protein